MLCNWDHYLTSCRTYSQKTGHWPARYPPFPPSLPAFNQVLKYGDLTANGRAGGRAGEKVESAPMEATKDDTNRPRCHSCIVPVVQAKTNNKRKDWTGSKRSTQEHVLVARIELSTKDLNRRIKKREGRESGVRTDKRLQELPRQARLWTSFDGDRTQGKDRRCVYRNARDIFIVEP